MRLGLEKAHSQLQDQEILMGLAQSSARPDFAAHDLAYRLLVDKVVTELCDVLGAMLVVYFAGANGTLAGSRTAAVALHVVEMLRDHDSAVLVQAWLQGLNPRFDDRSPARLLREGDLDEVGPQILAAARAFVTG